MRINVTTSLDDLSVPLAKRGHVERAIR
jgi:hypothetical protein